MGEAIEKIDSIKLDNGVIFTVMSTIRRAIANITTVQVIPFFCAKEIPETAKMLCINTSIIDFDDLKYKLADLPCVNKVLAYGEKDDEYMYASDLEELNLDNLRVITIAGADHEFTGMVDKFIDAVDLILK